MTPRHPGTQALRTQDKWFANARNNQFNSRENFRSIWVRKQESEITVKKLGANLAKTATQVKKRAAVISLRNTVFWISTIRVPFFPKKTCAESASASPSFSRIEFGARFPGVFGRLRKSCDEKIVSHAVTERWSREEDSFRTQLRTRKQLIDCCAAHFFAGTRKSGADAIFRHANNGADFLIAFAFQMVHPHDLGFGAFQFF